MIGTARAPVADVRTCSFQEPTSPLQTRVAALFVFWPLLTQLGFGELVEKAGYPGSAMVPATSALLSLLALKLIDKERRSHICDFNFDEALGILAGLGIFAGLNVLPKATFAIDYSYRTVRENQQRLLAGWISKLLPRLDPQPESILNADPAWVYFDSRLTTYAEMSRLNARGKTSFITIRRRGSRILRSLDDQPNSASTAWPAKSL